MNTITTQREFELHPSMVYPRKIHTHSTSETMCPACRSTRVEFYTHSPERGFKRQSICLDCSTVWTTRNSRAPLRYEQRFYK